MDRTVPAGAAILLDFIYRTDAGKSPPEAYQVIFGNRQNRLAKPITKMTLGELVDAQKNWSSKAWVKANWGYDTASSASGAAQFMRATLQDLAKELHLSGNQVFDPDLQDRLAYHLLKRRGYDLFMAGKISRTEFGRRLAMEWASFPVLATTKGAHRQVPRGSSYYMGDKLNKALVSPEVLEAVIDRAKAAGSAVQPAPVPSATPRELAPQDVEGEDKPVSHSKRFWTWITTGGGTAVLPFVDWRVQFLIVVVVVAFAVYAIATMPGVRKKLGLA